jgi:hypothetical protein
MSTSTIRPASVARHHDEPPAHEADGARTWVSRGANFIVAVSEVQAGATLTRQR